MSLDSKTIQQQLARLAKHRYTLAHFLNQKAIQSSAYVLPAIAYGIDEARVEIARIKAYLRRNGVEVEDEPNEVGVEDKTEDEIGPSSPHSSLHHLRAPVADFIGREQEINQIVTALRAVADSGTKAPICVIRGLGGGGKTELAYAVAQRLEAYFPDGQLLIELREATYNPMEAKEALQTIIRFFEKDAKLPNELANLQSLYRDKLSGRRILILTDNANDAAQVRPLMPPAGCMLLVTSRNRFNLPGAMLYDLDILPVNEAESLLLAICPRIGPQANKLAKLCGCLPLALRLSASLLKNSTRPVLRYLDQLETERLKYLVDTHASDNSGASVEASLRLSYESLDSATKSVLCQLSVFPTSFDIEAVLAVVAVEGDIEEMLDKLYQHSLLGWDEKTERYSLHDLVRALATMLLADTDAVKQRHAAHFARVTAQADEKYREGDGRDGLALFDTERQNIDIAEEWLVKRSDDIDTDRILCEMAVALIYLGDARYSLSQLIGMYKAALSAALRLNEQISSIRFAYNLAILHDDNNERDDAKNYYNQALWWVLAEKNPDKRRLSQLYTGLGILYRNGRDYDLAIANLQKSRDFLHELERIATDEPERKELRAQRAMRLTNLGTIAIRLDQYIATIQYNSDALELLESSDNRCFIVHKNIAEAYLRNGDFEHAEKHILHAFPDAQNDNPEQDNDPGSFLDRADGYRIYADFLYERAMQSDQEQASILQQALEKGLRAEELLREAFANGKGDPELHAGIYNVLARIQHARGEVAESKRYKTLHDKYKAR